MATVTDRATAIAHGKDRVRLVRVAVPARVVDRANAAGNGEPRDRERRDQDRRDGERRDAEPRHTERRDTERGDGERRDAEPPRGRIARRGVA